MCKSYNLHENIMVNIYKHLRGNQIAKEKNMIMHMNMQHHWFCRKKKPKHLHDLHT